MGSLFTYPFTERVNVIQISSQIGDFSIRNEEEKEIIIFAGDMNDDTKFVIVDGYGNDHTITIHQRKR